MTLTNEKLARHDAYDRLVAFAETEDNPTIYLVETHRSDRASSQTISYAALVVVKGKLIDISEDVATATGRKLNQYGVTHQTGGANAEDELYGAFSGQFVFEEVGNFPRKLEKQSPAYPSRKLFALRTQFYDEPNITDSDNPADIAREIEKEGRNDYKLLVRDPEKTCDMRADTWLTVYRQLQPFLRRAFRMDRMGK